MSSKPQASSFVMRTYYDGLQAGFSDLTATPGASIDDPSLTKQEFADESDINNIMATFQRTGEVYNSATLSPRYGDFTIVPDYQSALNLVIEARASFDSLSSKIRERFHNDPVEFLDFVSNENNAAEMRALGILEEASLPESPQDAATGAKASSATSSSDE